MKDLEKLYKRLVFNGGNLIIKNTGDCVWRKASCLFCPINEWKRTSNISCANEDDDKIIFEMVKREVRKEKLRKLLS